MPDIYFTNAKSKAVFSTEGPKPKFKALVVGLDAGRQTPMHLGDVVMYHFLKARG